MHPFATYICNDFLPYYAVLWIALHRDPFNSIYANFQRKRSLLSPNNATTEWAAYALAASQSYDAAWKSTLNVVFSEYVPGRDILNIRYEDLVDSKQQVAILEKVVSFLRFPLKFDRLECAFQLNRLYQDNIVISGKPIQSGSSTVLQSYAALSKDTLCKIWSNVQDYSHHFGYRMYGNVSCSGSVGDVSKRLRSSSTGGNVEQPWKRLFGHDTSVGNQVRYFLYRIRSCIKNVLCEIVSVVLM